MIDTDKYEGAKRKRLGNLRTLSDKEAKALGVPLGTMVRKNMDSRFMSKKMKDNVNFLKRLSKKEMIE